MFIIHHRYCPLCKNDNSEVVLAGEKLKASKKKSKMASASGKTTRDWGKVLHYTMDVWMLEIIICVYIKVMLLHML